MVQAARRIFILILIIFSASNLLAQQPVSARLSPLALTTLKYKDTYVKITYCQPHRRGREIFGQLVPYNEVWRTGANEATEITLTRDAYINGYLVPAGTYSLFSIPNPETWTIIINKETGLWGSYNYNAKLDLLRFDVPAGNAGPKPYEAFTIQFDQRNNVADLLLLWDKIKIVIPFQFVEPRL